MKPVALFSAILIALSLLPGVAAGAASSSTPAAQPAAGGMSRTEHEWKGDGRSSTFDVLRIGGEMKMIREQISVVAGIAEKNEYFFKDGALLHFKQDRYPESGKSGAAVATMASFSKAGKVTVSMKRIDGKPAGPASAQEIARMRKHLDELLLIAGKPQQ